MALSVVLPTSASARACVASVAEPSALPVAAPAPGSLPVADGWGVHFDALTGEDGLSSSDVFDITQDGHGFLWFVTADGLSRYDGYSVRVFRFDRDSTNSLGNNALMTLIAARDGVLWIGSDGGGVDGFDPATGRFTHYRSTPADPTGLSGNSVPVFGVLEDRQGMIWIGTYKAGIDRLDPGTGRFTHFPVDPEDPQSLGDDTIRALYRDSGGKLWVGTWDHGLSRFDPRTRTGRYVFQVQGTNEDGVWSRQTRSVAFTISPPWWETWWFRTAAALVLVLLAVALYRARIRTIQRRSQELERQVATRTAQLREVNQELESFSYSVSHDLRAPLRHIDGFVSLLQARTTESDERSRHYMDVIAESSRRMGTLIDGLLTFSRLGRSELALEPVDLDALVDDVVLEYGSQTEGRSVEWRRQPLPTVHGDPALLRAVLANLVGNALKFTRPRSEAVIEIGSLARPDDEGRHVILVRDNGVGFDMAYADQLFGVFQRLHTDEQFEGTGIGLATVQRIVVRHGGRVWAEASPDGGATFFVALPVDHTGQDDPPPALTPPLASPARPSPATDAPPEPLP